MQAKTLSLRNYQMAREDFSDDKDVTWRHFDKRMGKSNINKAAIHFNYATGLPN